MKFFMLFAAFFPLSSFALTASRPELVRVLDGNYVRCVESYELSKVSYDPSIVA
jgi:hypothetical protein